MNANTNTLERCMPTEELESCTQVSKALKVLAYAKLEKSFERVQALQTEGLT